MNPLERAADLIEKRGWCRGRFQDTSGRVCIDYALVLADLVNNARARTHVLDELRSRGIRCDDLVLWNDFEAAASDEVIDLLRHAAKRWNHREGATATSSLAG